MIIEQDVFQAITQANDAGRVQTLGEFIATVFKDRLVEIYLGDAYENVSNEQVSTDYPAVFCGKVVGAYRECLVMSSLYVKNDEVSFGNLIFINERAIRALTEINGEGSIGDIFFKSQEADILRKINDSNKKVKPRKKR